MNKPFLLAAAVLSCAVAGCANAREWRRDHDGNPPGPVGGPGTSWENPPGWRGGPGASPDRFGRCR